jgi:6,7-dimethyl-8-ribityllumazine synthase
MELQGSGTAAGYRFGIVVSKFNEAITAGLLTGARTALEAAQVRSEDITLVWVPGAFEIPLAAKRLAETGRFDAIVCLGCVIKGDTMHFEYIAGAVSQGIMDVATTMDIPVAFGVLTTLTEGQAVLRSAPGPDNKGREAALAAVEMATLGRRIGEAGLHEH